MSRFRYIVCRPRQMGTEVSTLREAKDFARKVSLERPYLFELWRIEEDGSEFLLCTAWEGRLTGV